MLLTNISKVMVLPLLVVQYIVKYKYVKLNDVKRQIILIFPLHSLIIHETIISLSRRIKHYHNEDKMFKSAERISQLVLVDACYYTNTEAVYESIVV